MALLINNSKILRNSWVAGDRIPTSDEAAEKRWLFENVRHNLQNISGRMELENRDFESSIDKYMSYLLQFRNNCLALVGFVATITASLATISLVNKEQVLWVLTAAFVFGIAVYLIINIVRSRTQIALSPIREAYYRIENSTEILKGLLGATPFYLETVHSLIV